jgi:repressor LexA
MNQKSVDRQKEIIKFVIDFSSKNGYPPSMREVASAVNVSSSATIHKILHECHRDGLLISTQGIVRSMRVTEEGKELLKS